MKLALLAAGVLLALQEPAIELITESYPDGSARSRCEAVRDASGTLVRHGLYERWYPDGRPESKGAFVAGLEDGDWEFWHPNGKRSASGSFERGLRTGHWKIFTDKGPKDSEGRYVAGRRDGEWTFYDWEASVGRGVLVRKVHLQFHEFRVPGPGWLWTGESADGLKDGRWRALRSDGTTALIGDYEDGVPTGPWCFFYGDGTFDGGWFSAVFDSGNAVQTLLEPPPELLAEATPRPGDLRQIVPQAPSIPREWVRRHLAGDVGAVDALLETPREAFQAAVAALLELDLADPLDEARAEQVHVEILARLLGGIPEWEHELQADTATVLRWHALWEFVSQSPTWPASFDPTYHWLVADVRLTEWDRRPVFEELLVSSPADARHEPGSTSGVRFLSRAAKSRETDDSGTAEPLESALAWIVAQQQADGSWDPTLHGGEARARTMCVSQCLLALLAVGNHPTGGKHADSVRSGSRWLVLQQDPASGRIGSDVDHAYEHALATCALGESACFSRLPTLHTALERAVTHLLSLQLENGSWAGVDGRSSDACATATAHMALKLAEAAGAVFDPMALARALSWLDSAVDPATHELREHVDGATGGLVDREPMTDAWHVAFARMFFTPEHAIGLASDPNLAKALLRGRPSNAGSRVRLEPGYVCAGSYVAYQCGTGKAEDVWDQWNEAMKPLVVERQIPTGPQAGSWADGRGTPGGTLLGTAQRALTLEVYFRYTRFSPEK